MVISVCEFGFVWNDFSDCRHQSEGLNASMLCGAKNIEARRNGTTIDLGRIEQLKGRIECAAFVGLVNSTSRESTSILDDNWFDLDDEIRIADLPPPDQVRLWNAMKKRY